MPSDFPGALDSFTDPSANQPLNNPSQSETVTKIHSALRAVEAKVGITGSAVATSHDRRITVLEDASTHTHVWNETPSGSINGSNTIFTLAAAPSPAGSLMLFLNGVLQRAGGTDFTLSSATITFVTAPDSGSILSASYVT